MRSREALAFPVPARRARLMNQSILLDETGRMLVVAGLICVVLLVPGRVRERGNRAADKIYR